MSTSRREFLQSTALGGLAAGTVAGAQTKLPTRMLGKTGERVSILAFGGGSRFFSIKDEEKAIQHVQRALEMGITYIDTSDDYGNGLSERLLGKALKGRKQGIFLATKISNRDAAAIPGIIETSLKNLQLDRVDLIHIHGLRNEADLAKLEAKGGVLEELMKAKERKLTRFIGMTCHADPAAMQKALEHHDLDCCQMALNAAMATMKGSKPSPDGPRSFEALALPVAVRKKMGIIAMKVFAQDKLQGQSAATAKNLIQYSLSLPITTAVVGMPKPEHLDENIQLARDFKPLSKQEMEKITGQLGGNQSALAEFFRDHVDA